MALQTLEGGGEWVPSWYPGVGWTLSNVPYLMDANAEIAALICRCPKAGDLDRFDLNIGAVGNSPDNGLRASFQGVDPSSGLPNGTILGATNNAKVTYAHTVTTGWKTTNFGETVTVTKGQLIACVVDWAGTFTSGDSIAIAKLLATPGPNSGFPYGVFATNTKELASFPLFALHYTDGYMPVTPFHPACNSASNVQYNSDTAGADEWGTVVQLPYPATLDAVAFQGFLMAASNAEIVVYDSADSVLSSIAHDGDVATSASAYGFTIPLSTAVDLAANTLYRVTVRPTNAQDVILSYIGFASAELMLTWPGGNDWYMTSRLNQAGAWTNYNSGTFRRARIHLSLTKHDDGVGGGGGDGPVGHSLIATRASTY